MAVPWGTAEGPSPSHAPPPPLPPSTRTCSAVPRSPFPPQVRSAFSGGGRCGSEGGRCRRGYGRPFRCGAGPNAPDAPPPPPRGRVSAHGIT